MGSKRTPSIVESCKVLLRAIRQGKVGKLKQSRVRQIVNKRTGEKIVTRVVKEPTDAH